MPKAASPRSRGSEVRLKLPACELARGVLQHGGNAACHGALAAPMVLKGEETCYMPMLWTCCSQASHKVRGPSVSAVWAEHSWAVIRFVVPGVGGEGVEK